MSAKIPFGNGHAALRRGRSSSVHHVYHVTVTTHGRAPLFLDTGAACAVAHYHHDKSCTKQTTMLAWVLMPDHAHWLLQFGEQDTLAAVVTRLKCSTARSANRVLGRTGPVWARAFHDQAMRNEEQILAVARYIVANPLRAGLVSRLGDYPFWNAAWL